VTNLRFQERVAEITARDDYVKPAAWAVGVATRAGDTTLDVYFPCVNLREHFRAGATIWDAAGGPSLPFAADLDADAVARAMTVFEWLDDPNDRTHPNLSALRALEPFAGGSDLDAW